MAEQIPHTQNQTTSYEVVSLSGEEPTATSAAASSPSLADTAAIPSPNPADTAAKPARIVAPPASNAAVRKCMQGNKRANTKPEQVVRAMLRDMGYTGYRLQWKKCPGHPDIAFPGRKIAIFVNGCFWHRCPYCTLPQPKSNNYYWQPKFDRNVERDRQTKEALEAEGWTVVVVWEHDLKKRWLEETSQFLYEVVSLEDPEQRAQVIARKEERAPQLRIIETEEKEAARIAREEAKTKAEAEKQARKEAREKARAEKAAAKAQAEAEKQARKEAREKARAQKAAAKAAASSSPNT